MAVRLPVVICQHERRSGRFAEYEEQCITSLLFQQRLDATLVSDLASIQPHSTDFLCLDGIKGDFVLMTWASSEESYSELHRIGFQSWELVPLDGGERLKPISGASTKRVYYFLFRLEETVDSATSRLNKLLDSLSTPVVSLMPKKPGTAAEKATGRTLAVLPPSAVVNSGIAGSQQPELPETGRESGLGQSNPAPLSANSDSKFHNNTSKIDDDFPNIDRLVLDLDNFDA